MPMTPTTFTLPHHADGLPRAVLLRCGRSACCQRRPPRPHYCPCLPTYLGWQNWTFPATCPVLCACRLLGLLATTPPAVHTHVMQNAFTRTCIWVAAPTPTHGSRAPRHDLVPSLSLLWQHFRHHLPTLGTLPAPSPYPLPLPIVPFLPHPQTFAFLVTPRFVGRYAHFLGP